MMDDNTKFNVLMPGITSIATYHGCKMIWDGLKPCIQRKDSDRKNQIDVQKVIDLLDEGNYHGLSIYIKVLCL